MEYNSSAFIAFQSNVQKYDALRIFNPVKDAALSKEKDKNSWEINLFRLEEFEMYKSVTDAYNILSGISRTKENGIENPFVATQIISCYLTAKKLLNIDPDIRKVLDIVKANNLNYIMHGTYNSIFTYTPYSQGKSVCDLLFAIDNELIFTDIYKQSIDRKKRVYGYKDEELKYFILPKEKIANIEKINT